MTFHSRRAPALRWPLALALISVGLFAAQLHSPAPAQAAPGYDAEELQFLEMLNDYRAENGAGPVRLSDKISAASERHSEDMGTYGFFDHYTRASDYYPAGSAPWDRMEAEGFDCSGGCSENIAAGYATAEEAFEAWRTSTEGHDENMLDPAHQVTGIARVYVEGSPYGWYWTSGFGDVDDGSGEEMPEDPTGGSDDADDSGGGSDDTGDAGDGSGGFADGASINLDENASGGGESSTRVCVVENGEQSGDCEETSPEQMQRLQNDLLNFSGGGTDVSWLRDLLGSGGGGGSEEKGPGTEDRPEPSGGQGGKTSVLGRCGGPPEVEAPSRPNALRGFADAFSRRMDRWADGYAGCVGRQVERDVQKGMRGALDF